MMKRAARRFEMDFPAVALAIPIQNQGEIMHAKTATAKAAEQVQLKPPVPVTREDLRRLLVEMIRRNEAERRAKSR